MNKVTTINLNGNAFQLEEGGFEALRAYLDGAARQLEGNPDRDEIIADIEQAIADKCRAVLGAYKTVVGAKEVEQIVEEMGPVEDASAEAESGSAAAGAATGTRSGGPEAETRAGPPIRRLYRIPHGRRSPGVCSGLAAYFDIDVSLVRFVFLLFTFFWGIGFVAYVLLLFLLPIARTPAEMASAHGPPPTAQEFIRRAKEGYYEGMKTFADKHAHREWRRRFRREMRSWRRTFHNEMHEHVRGWRPGGPPGWVPGFPPGIGTWFALPFVSIMRVGLALLWIFMLISLLATGTVFGVPLPGGFPVWAGVLCLIVLYHFLAWPLKAMRRAYYWNVAGRPFYAPPFIYAFDAVVGIGFVVLLLWLAVHHLPQIHDAIRNIPPQFHEAVETMKSWWAQK
ncbi:MAG TPA: PspC domain-containing protein [Opitutaceae bacterium]|nr:PspC domain-containing protein [Opitutaceae bacterium]